MSACCQMVDPKTRHIMSSLECPHAGFQRQLAGTNKRFKLIIVCPHVAYHMSYPTSKNTS